MTTISINVLQFILTLPVICPKESKVRLLP
jgi:hypothetical protein